MLNFLKQFLFIDQFTGKISPPRLFQSIGSAAMCWAFVYCVLHDKATLDIWIVFGSFILGNSTANKILNLKYGAKAETTTGDTNDNRNQSGRSET